MSASDPADGLMTSRGRSYARVSLWVCGALALTLISTHAVTCGLAALRTWYLTTLSTRFLSAMVIAQPSGATTELNVAAIGQRDCDSNTPAPSPSAAAPHR